MKTGAVPYKYLIRQILDYHMLKSIKKMWDMSSENKLCCVNGDEKIEAVSVFDFKHEIKVGYAGQYSRNTKHKRQDRSRAFCVSGLSAECCQH